MDIVTKLYVIMGIVGILVLLAVVCQPGKGE